jgi:predicted component of type VI protein secretion system
MNALARMAHDLRWIAIDQLGMFKEPAKVEVKIETRAAPGIRRVNGPRDY